MLMQNELLIPNIAEAQAFLDALYGGVPGETIEFRLIYGAGRDGVKPIRKFVTLPVSEEIFTGLTKGNNDGYNIYFGVATRRYNKPSFVPAIWADIDFKHSRSRLIDPGVLTQLRLYNESVKPSVVVQSGHGIHAYWITSAGPDEGQVIQGLNRRLAKRFGGDNVSDLARVMRLPGYYNVKDQTNPQLCWVSSNLNMGKLRVYQLNQLEEWLVDTPVPTLDANLEKLIRYGNQGQYQSRSEADFAVVIGMARAGFSDGEIYQAFRGGIGEKAREKGNRGQEYLARTIAAARKHLKEDV